MAEGGVSSFGTCTALPEPQCSLRCLLAAPPTRCCTCPPVVFVAQSRACCVSCVVCRVRVGRSACPTAAAPASPLGNPHHHHPHVPSNAQAETLGPDAMLAAALRVLRSLFGEEAVPHPRAWVVSQWGAEAYTRGSYSYVAVGASGEDYDLLSRPWAKVRGNVTDPPCVCG